MRRLVAIRTVKLITKSKLNDVIKVIIKSLMFFVAEAIVWSVITYGIFIIQFKDIKWSYILFW